MIVALFFIAGVLALLACAALYIKYRMNKLSDNTSLEAAIDAEVKKSMKSGAFTGLVVGVVKDEKVLIKGYGCTDKESGQCPDAHSVFQIGSVTKVLTASLLQRLCDEGVVSMDATLDQLIGETVTLSPTVRDVTLRQLVTHTSGFPRIPKPLADKLTQVVGDKDVMVNPYSYLGPEVMFDYLASAKGKRKAGRFDYSNYGMGLLAHVLEVVVGESFESMVREQILLPLGMQQTAIERSAHMQPLVQGYSAKDLPVPPWTFAALGGAGAFSSTAQDLITFVQASLAKNGLAAELLAKMREPECKGDTGIGWMQPSMVDRFFGNASIVWHNGMVSGYTSYLAINTQTRTGVVVLSNRASSVDMLGIMLLRRARTQSW